MSTPNVSNVSDATRKILSFFSKRKAGTKFYIGTLVKEVRKVDGWATAEAVTRQLRRLRERGLINYTVHRKGYVYMYEINEIS